MRFWALTVSLIPRNYDLFYQEGKERDISLISKSLISYQDHSHENKSPIPNIIVGKIVESSNNLLGLYAKRELAHIYDENFNRFDQSTFPPRLWIWDISEQALLIQIDKKIFSDAERAAFIFENILNDYLSQHQVEAKIYPKLQEDGFWEVVHSLETIHEVHFEYATPNLFGKTKEEMTKFLQEVRNATNANVFVTELRNEDGNLKPKKDGFLDRAIDWIKDGGGKWSIVGKQSPKARKIRISSGKQAQIYNLPDGTLKVDTQGYTAADLAKIINALRPNYSFRKNEDKLE